MTRILIASSLDRSRAQLSQILTASGFSIYRLCSTDDEIRRCMDNCDHALLILAGLLPDTCPETLLADFRNQLRILLIAKPPVISEHSAIDLFHLSFPCSGNAVVGAVEMLLQLHAMSHPQRSASDRLLVEQAKRQLMDAHGMTEPEAHHYMQNYAMNHGVKMTDYARQILNQTSDRL